MRWLIILLLISGCTVTPERLGEIGEVVNTTGQVVQTAAPGPLGIILSAIGGIITAVAASKGYRRFSNHSKSS